MNNNNQDSIIKKGFVLIKADRSVWLERICTLNSENLK